MTFEELDLPTEILCKEVKINETVSLGVDQYLPIEKKSELITFVTNSALDTNTGCFSPLRVEVYFALGVVKYYSTLDIGEVLLSDIGKLYDALEMNGIIDKIMDAIPEDELNFVRSLVLDTIADIARYNNSFVGTLNAMSGEATGLSEQIDNIIQGMKSKEGLELISSIKERAY